MAWYVKEDNSWERHPSPPTAEHCIHVRTEETRPPEVRFLEDRQEFFHLTGTEPRPASETTHTIASIDFARTDGSLLFAVHTADSHLTFEELRSDRAENAYSDDAFDQAQSLLSEILLPVYIDDVVSDLSEGQFGLVALHTVQYDSDENTSWTYFRASTFSDGELVFEEEHGEL